MYICIRYIYIYILYNYTIVYEYEIRSKLLLLKTSNTQHLTLNYTTYVLI